jgi:hypothetical protein
MPSSYLSVVAPFGTKSLPITPHCYSSASASGQPFRASRHRHKTLVTDLGGVAGLGGVEPEVITMTSKHIVAVALALLITTEAHAQQRTKYRRHTGSDDGTLTVYGGADGKVQGRTSTDSSDSSDTVTIHFGDRRETGSVTITPKPHQGK